MSVMTSQITSLKIVYSTIYSGTDQRKHQSSASLAFVWGIPWWPLWGEFIGDYWIICNAGTCEVNSLVTSGLSAMLATCEVNSLVTNGFSAQSASNVEVYPSHKVIMCIQQWS